MCIPDCDVSTGHMGKGPLPNRILTSFLGDVDGLTDQRRIPAIILALLAGNDAVISRIERRMCPVMAAKTVRMVMITGGHGCGYVGRCVSRRVRRC